MLPLAILAASAIGAGATAYGVNRANAANKAMAREQMGFQREMSGTSYQRAMEDMRQAGLNPILAYQQGGASTPAGASATMQDSMGPAVNSAVSIGRAKAEIQNILEMNKKIKSDVALNEALEKSAMADAGLKHNSSKSVIADTILKNAQIPGAQNRAAVDSGPAGKVLSYWDRFMQSLGLGTKVLGR